MISVSRYSSRAGLKLRSNSNSRRRRPHSKDGRPVFSGRRSRIWILAPLAIVAAYSYFALGYSHSQTGGLIANLTASRPAAISGVASVVDGDTIEIHGQRIRFNGIDAPESRQLCRDAIGVGYPCGRRSAEALDSFLSASRPVQCTFVTWDRYHRFVGECRRADGVSVASWMVEHGQALDWPQYSHGAYAQQQTAAESAKVGVWVGTFEAPWDWRTEHADNSQAATDRQLRLVNHGQVAQSYSCHLDATALRSRRVRKRTGISTIALGAPSSIEMGMEFPVKASADSSCTVSCQTPHRCAARAPVNKGLSRLRLKTMYLDALLSLLSGYLSFGAAGRALIAPDRTAGSHLFSRIQPVRSIRSNLKAARLRSGTRGSACCF